MYFAQKLHRHQQKRFTRHAQTTQRRTYGPRDEEYPQRKILTCMMPILQNEPKPPTQLREEP